VQDISISKFKGGMIRGLINKAKKKLHLHASGALKECKPGKHVSPN